jgi:hypothetical protein
MPAGTSSWDLAAKTVTFHVPRDYLAAAGITSPYFVSSQSAYGALAREWSTTALPSWATRSASPTRGC